MPPPPATVQLRLIVVDFTADLGAPLETSAVCVGLGRVRPNVTAHDLGVGCGKPLHNLFPLCAKSIGTQGLHHHAAQSHSL